MSGDFGLYAMPPRVVNASIRQRRQAQLIRRSIDPEYAQRLSDYARTWPNMPVPVVMQAAGQGIDPFSETAMQIAEQAGLDAAEREFAANVGRNQKPVDTKPGSTGLFAMAQSLVSKPLQVGSWFVSAAANHVVEPVTRSARGVSRTVFGALSVPMDELSGALSALQDASYNAALSGNWSLGQVLDDTFEQIQEQGSSSTFLEALNTGEGRAALAKGLMPWVSEEELEQGFGSGFFLAGGEGSIGAELAADNDRFMFGSLLMDGIAEVNPGLGWTQEGSRFHGIVSGVGDLGFEMLADPLNLPAGVASAAQKARRLHGASQAGRIGRRAIEQGVVPIGFGVHARQVASNQARSGARVRFGIGMGEAATTRGVATTPEIIRSMLNSPNVRPALEAIQETSGFSNRGIWEATGRVIPLEEIRNIRRGTTDEIAERLVNLQRDNPRQIDRLMRQGVTERTARGTRNALTLLPKPLQDVSKESFEFASEMLNTLKVTDLPEEVIDDAFERMIDLYEGAGGLATSADQGIRTVNRSVIKTLFYDKDTGRGVLHDFLVSERNFSPKEARELVQTNVNRVADERAMLAQTVADNGKISAVHGGQITETDPLFLAEQIGRMVSLPNMRDLTRAGRFGNSRHYRIKGAHLAAADAVNRAWVPAQLIRGAWTVRVVGEEQIRMMAAGLNTRVRHPFQMFMAAIGKKPTDDFFSITGQDMMERDIFGLFVDDTVQEVGRVRGPLSDANIQREGMYQNLTRQDPNYGQGWAFSINKAAASRDLQRLARVQLGGMVDDGVNSLDEFVGWVIRGEHPDAQLIKNDLRRIYREPDNLDDVIRQHIHKGNEVLSSLTQGDEELMRLIARDVAKVEETGRVARTGRVRDRKIVRNPKSVARTNKKLRDPDSDVVLKDVAREFGLSGRGMDESTDIGREVREALQERLGLGESDELSAGRVLSEAEVQEVRQILRDFTMDPARRRMDPTVGQRVNKRELREILEDKFFDDELGEWTGPEQVNYMGSVGSAAETSKWDGLVNRAFESFMGRPSRELSRLPAFKQFYHDEIARLSQYVDPSLRSAIDVSGNDGLRRVIDRAPIVQDEALRIGSLEELDNIAKANALSETQELLYDIFKKQRWSELNGDWFAFAGAWQEVITRWAGQDGLLRRNVQNANRLRQIIDPNYGVWGEDENGNSIFNYPLIGGLIQALSGVPTGATGSAQSLNIGMSVMPGFGPIAQFSAELLLKDQPNARALLDVVAPFREQEASTLDTAFTTFLPSWARGPVQVMFGVGAERQWASTQIEVAAVLVEREPEKYTGPEGFERAMADSASAAKMILVARGALQSFLPTSPRVQPNFELDDGRQLPFATLAAAWRDIQEASEDNVEATREFIRQYGTDPAFFSGKTESVNIRSFSVPGSAWERANPDLVDKYRSVIGLFAPVGSFEGDEFDPTSFSEAVAAGDSVRRDPDEWLMLVNQRRAGIRYELAKERIEQMGYTGREAEALQALVREELIAEFHGFRRQFGADTPTADTRVRDVRQALQDERIVETDAGQFAQRWLGMHDLLLRQSGTATLKGEGVRRQRQMLQLFAEREVEKNPNLLPIWQRVLSSLINESEL